LAEEQKLQGAREPENRWRQGQAEIWRNAAGMGPDRQLTTAPGTGRRLSLPQGFSLCHLPPLLCRLPDPHPPRSRWWVPRCFSPMRLPRCTAAHTCSQRKQGAPGAACCWCTLSGMAGSHPSSPWGTGCFLLEAAACQTTFISLLSQLLQAGMPGQPPPQLEPLSTAGLGQLY